MKMIRQYTVVNLFIVLTSCSGFLVEDDRSLITYDEFFQEAGDAQFAVDAIYSHFNSNSFYAKYYWLIPTLASDLAVTEIQDADLQEFSNFTISPSNKIIETIWSELYAAISTCNFAIQHLPGAAIGESEQEALLAESRFLRAFFYLDLVRFFGDIPLQLEFSSEVDQTVNLQRAHKDSVLTFIANEFRTVADFLPIKNEGRPTQIAALAYLTKTYVLLKKYPQAYLASRMVLNQGTLLDDFADVFKISNNLNQEIIFAISFNSLFKGPMNQEALPIELSGDAIAHPSDHLINSFDPQDRRLTSTFGQFSDKIYVTKFWDRDAEPNGGETKNDLPLLRLPDIMLTHAEIINEVRKNTNAEAIQLINTIRSRARFDGMVTNNILPDLRTMNYDLSKQAILDERQRELAFEGYRWFDLVRNEKLVEYVLAAKPNVDVSIKHHLFPIPQSALDRNPLLTQNPGY